MSVARGKILIIIYQGWQTTLLKIVLVFTNLELPGLRDLTLKGKAKKVIDHCRSTFLSIKSKKTTLFGLDFKVIYFQSFFSTDCSRPATQDW